jgi:hypothetical protein
MKVAVQHADGKARLFPCGWRKRLATLNASRDSVSHNGHMALTLNCSCGACFEVEDTFGGQSVACPECQTSVAVPARNDVPLRTSGLALTSVLLALIGAFTILFTLVAVLLGLSALVSIARNRDRLAGRGYALFGIGAGAAFTVLSFFLYSSMELLPVDGFFEAGMLSSQIDYSGDREVVRKDAGFSITRPSAKWGIARQAMLDSMDSKCDVMLVNAYRHCYVQVSRDGLFGRSLDEFVDAIIKVYQEDERPGRKGLWNRTRGGFKLRQRRALPPADGAELVELAFDLNYNGQDFSYVEHVYLAGKRDTFYRVLAWTARRRFPQMEPELRRSVDSFRLLP